MKTHLILSIDSTDEFEPENMHLLNVELIPMTRNKLKRYSKKNRKPYLTYTW